MPDKPIRTDGVLYSGITSASYAQVKEKKEELKQAKKDLRVKIEPDAQFILDEIAKEKAGIPQKVWELTNSTTDGDGCRAVLTGLRMYDEYLDNLKNKMANILRTNSAKDEVSDE